MARALRAHCCFVTHRSISGWTTRNYERLRKYLKLCVDSSNEGIREALFKRDDGLLGTTIG
jgi:hypothetical protein